MTEHGCKYLHLHLKQLGTALHRFYNPLVTISTFTVSLTNTLPKILPFPPKVLTPASKADQVGSYCIQLLLK